MFYLIIIIVKFLGFYLFLELNCLFFFGTINCISYERQTLLQNICKKYHQWAAVLRAVCKHCQPVDRHHHRFPYRLRLETMTGLFTRLFATIAHAREVGPTHMKARMQA